MSRPPGGVLWEFSTGPIFGPVWASRVALASSIRFLRGIAVDAGIRQGDYWVPVVSAVADLEAKGKALWLKAAAKGVGLAMYGIGMLHYNGEGVPQDENEALMWMRRAEAAGGQAAILAREVIARIKGR